jgi:hypothetical protein
MEMKLGILIWSVYGPLCSDLMSEIRPFLWMTCRHVELLFAYYMNFFYINCLIMCIDAHIYVNWMSCR